MATCPNCGEIVMEGDPYCANCGTTFRWVGDEDDSKDRVGIGTVKLDLVAAKSLYDKGDYSAALGIISNASQVYSSLSSQERSRAGDDPFCREWVVDLLCKVFNSHQRDEVEVMLGVLKNHSMRINVCNECDLCYPESHDYCMKCGSFLERPYKRRNPQRVREEINDVLDSMFVNPYHKILLANKAVSLIESGNCSLEGIIEVDMREIEFIFEKEHEFFTTTYRCWFDSEYFSPDRVFYDSVCSSNHDRLLKNSKFKRLVKDTEKSTGFTFLRCGGGYEDPDIDIVTSDITFNDRYHVFVQFRTDDGGVASYDIDLDRMELSEEYRKY